MTTELSSAEASGAIARWLLPILWREHDWRAALSRLAVTATRANRLTGARAHRTAIELAQAIEYIEPDRRRAIAVYELAGDHERARELAGELGWWSARARLSARIIDSPEHVLDEAEAWWDAGQPDLCALALAEVRGADRGVRGVELAALVANTELADHAGDAVKRAVEATGTEAADAYVMAARFCRAQGQMAEVTQWLEAAVQADPKHVVAARFLLELARMSRDPNAIKRFLRVRFEGADALTWLDGMRSCALALLDGEAHRGFGQRLLRQILERAYAGGHTEIPGHLAMWTALAAHSSAAGTRRELLPFVIDALQATQLDVDRVWLGALATEISLRDGKNPVVAGAYAEIVAEHAPDHPIVRELVAVVADAVEDEPTSPISIPVAAINAAKQENYVDIDIELESAYAEAADHIDNDASSSDEEDPDEPPVAIVSTMSSPIQVLRPDAVPVFKAVADPSIEVELEVEVEAPAQPAPAPKRGRPRTPQVAATQPLPLPSVKPAPTAPTAPARAPSATPEPIPVEPVSTMKIPLPNRKPAAPASVAPASIARPSEPAKPASIVPASIPNPASLIPALPKLPAPPRNSQKIATGALPPISRAVPPVLAALRTPDRPELPPRPPDPPNAKIRARRISIPIDVRLLLPDGGFGDGTSRDLSTTGMFVLTSTALTVDDELVVALLLPGKEAFTEEEYRSRARVVRKADDGYGLELLAPDADLVAALDQLG